MPEMYVCTNVSQDKCVNRNKLVDPFIDDLEECWVDPLQANNTNPCVSAFDVEGAKAACVSLCTNFETDAVMNIETHNAPAGRQAAPEDTGRCMRHVQQRAGRMGLLGRSSWGLGGEEVRKHRTAGQCGSLGRGRAAPAHRSPQAPSVSQGS